MFNNAWQCIRDKTYTPPAVQATPTPTHLPTQITKPRILEYELQVVVSGGAVLFPSKVFDVFGGGGGALPSG